MGERGEKNDQSQIRAELFEALSHETRIRILQALGEQPVTFAELKRALHMESSGNLQHHLGKLGGLVKQTDDGLYALTDDGKEALRTLRMVKDIDRTSGAYPKDNGDNRWWHKWSHDLENPRLFPLVVVEGLLIGLVGLAVYMWQPTFESLLLLGSLLSFGFAYILAGLFGRLQTGRRSIASLAFFLLSSSYILWVCGTYYLDNIAVSGRWAIWAILVAMMFFLTYVNTAHRFLRVYEQKP